MLYRKQSLGFPAKICRRLPVGLECGSPISHPEASLTSIRHRFLSLTRIPPLLPSLSPKEPNEIRRKRKPTINAVLIGRQRFVRILIVIRHKFIRPKPHNVLLFLKTRFFPNVIAKIHGNLRKKMKIHNFDKNRLESIVID